jgi:hypothetical protein
MFSLLPLIGLSCHDHHLWCCWPQGQFHQPHPPPIYSLRSTSRRAPLTLQYIINGMSNMVLYEDEVCHWLAMPPEAPQGLGEITLTVSPNSIHYLRWTSRCSVGVGSTCRGSLDVMWGNALLHRAIVPLRVHYESWAQEVAPHQVHEVAVARKAPLWRCHWLHDHHRSWIWLACRSKLLCRSRWTQCHNSGMHVSDGQSDMGWWLYRGSDCRDGVGRCIVAARRL